MRSLPTELAPHREVMLEFMREAERDPGIRLLVVGCSIGRGVADELSDVDAMYAVTDTAWLDAVRESAAVVRRVGDVIDMHQQIIEPPDRGLAAYQHTFAQYASGVQLDLVVSVARERHIPRPRRRYASGCTSPSYISAPARNTSPVGLSGRRTRSSTPHAASSGACGPSPSASRIRSTGSRRCSTLRTLRCRRTSEATVAGLDRRALRSAAMACGELLVWTWPRAISTVASADLAMPPLAEWVLRQLRDVAT
jgi:hypothetical protein